MTVRAPLLQLLLAGFTLPVVLAVADDAKAQYTVTIPSTVPNLGIVGAAGAGDTVFRLSPSGGLVTVVSGSGTRATNSSITVTITISCGNQGFCNNDQPWVLVGPAGSPTNRAKPLTNFTVSGSSILPGTIMTTANTINFQMQAIPKNSSRSFTLGMDFPIKGDDSGAPTGLSQSSFYVYADGSNPPTTGWTGTARATVYKKLSLAKTSDLQFGRLVKPVNGSGIVAIDSADANSDPRLIFGAVGLGVPTPTRAAYTVTGEPGAAISISIPSSFTMTRVGGGGLSVDTNDTTLGLTTLVGGVYTFYVGGEFPITSSTPTGSYNGTFNVTVSYN